MRILSVYASAHGSTAEVARFMGEVWQRRCIGTAVSAADPVPSAEGHDAYVLGSAVHNGLWLPEMAAFVRRSRELLSKKPVYLWLTCMRAIEPGGYVYVTNNYLPNLLSCALSFRRIAIFAGKVDWASIDRNEAWTLAFRYDGGSDPATLQGDHRDWNAIGAWAEQIADDLEGPPYSLSA